MAELLYITANPATLQQSYSLAIGEAFLQEYEALYPEDTITRLDLFQMDIPLIDQDVLSAWGKLRAGQSLEALTLEEARKLGAIHKLTEQFMQADKYVFVSPFWNLSIPPVLKAYIDTIVIEGKTFNYTERGPVGQLSGKKGLHIQARGGIYSGELNHFEFGDKYVVAIMSFLGVAMQESIIAEGMAYNPEMADEIKAAAMENAVTAAKQFAI